MDIIIKLLRNFKKLKKADQQYLIRLGLAFIGIPLLIIIGIIWLLIIALSPDNKITLQNGAMYKNGLYYCSQADGAIMCYSVSAEKSSPFCEYKNCTDLTVYEHYLYFIGESERRGIYRTSLKGGQTEMLIKGDYSHLFVLNDTMVYLQSDNEEGEIFIADWNGKFRHPIAGKDVTGLVFDGENIYFSDTGGLKSYNTETKTETTLNGSINAHFISVCEGELIYYNAKTSAIERLSEDTYDPQILLNAKCDSLHVDFDKQALIYYNEGTAYIFNYKKASQKEKSIDLSALLYIDNGYVYSLEGNKVKCEKIKKLM